MLGYVFWHRPRGGVPAQEYEEAQLAFHRSLQREPPGGLLGSACLRADLPWLEGEGPGYEDWYVLRDHAALGVLGEAATGRGHRTSHDRAARASGRGAGGLYALLDGAGDIPAAIAAARVAVWVTPSRGGRARELAELLADGAETPVSVWRRELVLGPAPEFCVLAGEQPLGVASTRLPEGWTAQAQARSAVHPAS